MTAVGTNFLTGVIVVLRSTGHPLLTAAFGSSCRLAYFDWSNGHLEASEDDLPLDPNLSLQAIVAKLERWMPN